MIFVIPARRDSRRCANKNHREFHDGRSLTDLAVQFAHACGCGAIRVVSNNIPRGAVAIRPYPKWDGNEVNNSVDIWRYALRGELEGGLTALIEPSCFRHESAVQLFRRADQAFRGTTTIAIKPIHRYGLKMFAFVPAGTFYLATVKSVLDGSVFDGAMDYVIDEKSRNIDTEEDFLEAQALCA